jgi:hypothetical protein
LEGSSGVRAVAPHSTKLALNIFLLRHKGFARTNLENPMEIEKISPNASQNIQPVRFIETDDPLAPPRPGVALCLSRGGYRAMLFHLGALWRLNEVGLLKSLVRVSSFSGGSITAGMLGLKWKKLQFDSSNTASNLSELVIDPIRRLSSVTVDQGTILWGILLPRKTIADEVAQAYREHRYCQLNSRRNKNRESDKMNRRSSSGQLTIALTQIASSHTANLDFITAR